MAQRRMISLKIVDTDIFLDMPLTARYLYLEFCTRADDEGFIASPKKILRMVGCSDDDFKILMAKQFIIPFESGVCVIKHWKIHNYIRSDRFTETIYLNEKSLLAVDENSAYVKVHDENTHYVIPNVIPDVNQVVGSMDTQVRLGKDRLGKVSKGKDRLEEGKGSKETIETLIDAYASPGSELNKTLLDFVEMRKEIKKKVTTRALKMILNKLNKLADDEYTKIKILEQSILHSWQDVYELKQVNSNYSVNNSPVDKAMQGLANWLNEEGKHE
ncbi:hypothetical protein [Zhenhengia sp.]|uniref:hypothetical protein n=1 Tax=Zhenhengia sp. TaxID=2944208 RepID=UPI0030791413